MMLHLIVNQFIFLIKERMNYNFNWFCTVKASFSFFKFKDAIKFPILIYGDCQYWNKGRIILNLDSIERGIISIGKKRSIEKDLDKMFLHNDLDYLDKNIIYG